MMSKLMAALVAGAFATIPMTAAFAEDKAPDCKKATVTLINCKKANSTTAECKAAEATSTSDACKQAAAAAPAVPPKKQKKGGC